MAKKQPKKEMPWYLFPILILAALLGFVEGVQKGSKSPPGERRG